VRWVWVACLFALFAAPSLAQPPHPEPPLLRLICDGIGTYAGPDRRPAQIEGKVLVEVTDATHGRIKIPDVLMPPVRDNSDQGWRPLEELNATDTVIAGRVRLNFINRPTVRIDRVSGHMDVKAGGQPLFGGGCRSAGVPTAPGR